MFSFFFFFPEKKKSHAKNNKRSHTQTKGSKKGVPVIHFTVGDEGRAAERCRESAEDRKRFLSCWRPLANTSDGGRRRAKGRRSGNTLWVFYS